MSPRQQLEFFCDNVIIIECFCYHHLSEILCELCLQSNSFSKRQLSIPGNKSALTKTLLQILRKRRVHCAFEDDNILELYKKLQNMSISSASIMDTSFKDSLQIKQSPDNQFLQFFMSLLYFNNSVNKLVSPKKCTSKHQTSLSS